MTEFLFFVLFLKKFSQQEEFYGHADGLVGISPDVNSNLFKKNVYEILFYI